jgi:VanZ family protein
MNPHLSRRLLLCYWIFVVYGSFIPFIFNLDPNFVHWRLNFFLSRSLYRGITRWAWADVIVNVGLYAPLGLFALASLRRSRWLGHSPVAPLIIGAVGLCAGFSVELGQTLSPYRSPSMLDALCNGFGALLGAGVGFCLTRPRSRGFGSRVSRLARARPAQALAVVLLCALLAENYYPFTLASGLTLRFNLAQALRFQFWPATLQGWIDVFFDHGLICAALGFALYHARRLSYPSAALGAWLLASFAAAIIEAGTVFFVGSAFQLAEILVSSAGALLGVTIIPVLSSLGAIKARRETILLAAMLALLCYFELRPFDWIHIDELPAKISRIEWLPFVDYYWARPQVALFDLAKKLFLALPLGYLFAAASPMRQASRRSIYAAGFSGFVILLLETCQLGVGSRVTSITDVLSFTSGAWVGAQAFDWIKSAPEPTAERGNTEPARIETASIQLNQQPASASKFEH